MEVIQFLLTKLSNLQFFPIRNNLSNEWWHWKPLVFIFLQLRIYECFIWIEIQRFLIIF